MHRTTQEQNENSIQTHQDNQLNAIQVYKKNKDVYIKTVLRMSVTSRFPFALIQQLQKDVESLSRAVTNLQTQNATDSALILSLQNTLHSVCAVLSSTTTTEADNVFMQPTFTDCTVGVLNYKLG